MADLTMRDQFAIAALTGLLAQSNPTTQRAYQSVEDFAEEAYDVADAMMVARKQDVRDNLKGFG